MQSKLDQDSLHEGTAGNYKLIKLQPLIPDARGSAGKGGGFSAVTLFAELL